MSLNRKIGSPIASSLGRGQRTACAGKRFLALHTLDVAISMCWMAFRQIGPAAEQLFAQCSLAIGRWVGTTPLQLRHKIFNDVFEGFVRHCVGEIVAVNVCLFGPFLQNVRDRRRRPNKNGPKTANATPARKLSIVQSLPPPAK